MPARISRVLCFLLLATACFGGEPVPRSYFGMNLNRPPENWPEAGFGSLRLWDSGTSWQSLNGSSGSYDWSKLDHWLDLADKNHVDVLYVFGRTPSWASSRPGLGSCSYGPGQCAPPAEMRDWENFVRALVQHSAGRIHAWELWNEANTPEGWHGSMEDLVQMSRLAYAIIKKAQPDAVVLTPSATGTGGPDWMQRYLRAGGADAADAIAFHGYCCATDPENIYRLIGRYKGVSLSFGKSVLWDTEASWGQATKLPDENARVAFVARYYALHWSAGVTRFYWYAWDNKDWGKLSAEGVRLAAGKAYNEMSRWLVAATITTPCFEADGVWRCQWKLADGSEATLAWSGAESPRTIHLPPQYRSVKTLDGETRPAAADEQVTSLPLLFVADSPKTAEKGTHRKR